MTYDFDKLNDEQKKAVTATEGFVRVIAGAGTGKTRALVHRFAFLVNEIGILPGHILCVTFTNKAAGEMRSRIHNLTGDNDTGYICTFHSFCVSVLHEDAHILQYPESFLVLDNSDIDAMLATVYEERGLTLRHMTYSAARDKIEMLKLKEKTDYYKDLIHLSISGLKEKYEKAESVTDIIFYGYLYEQKKCFGLDYNDLITLSLYIFENHPDIRLKWQERLEYIMVDEFQDIDEPQYKLMKVLCAYHKNLFIVGDPDQTIYTWRGASIRYILNFHEEFPDTETIYLLQNYRSTPQIISVCNSLIRHNKNRAEKDLIPTLPDGEKVVCHYATDSEKEAEWIADEVEKLHESGVPYKDITVMYRAHYVTRTPETVFMKRKIPYVLYSGVPFYGRAEIKDALSYLRMLVYKDDLSFLRIVNRPKRNIGERRKAFLKAYAEEHGCSLYAALKAAAEAEEPLLTGTGAKEFIELIETLSRDYAARQVSEVLSELLDKSGYEKMLRTEGSSERLDNLAELKQAVHEYETTCGEESTAEQFLISSALYSGADAAESGDKVRFMTVHAAKGLEFPYVFLCGMNEGIFPSKRLRTKAEMEEERRLAFVAMTRAEKKLYLSEAAGRDFDGSPRYPSRFLLDIDSELLDFTEPPREGLIEDARAYISVREKLLTDKETVYRSGMRVRHSIFGFGTILDTDVQKGMNKIQFDDMPTARQISYRVKLELLGQLPTEETEALTEQTEEL